MSIISDDGASITSPDDHPSPSNSSSNWSGLQSRAATTSAADYFPQHEVISKGPQKAEIQLR